MSDDWLPPRRGRADDPRFGDPTPSTVESKSREPSLREISPDDPAVTALVSPLPDPAAPLPSLDDDETPPPFDPGDPIVQARKERQRPVANAELLRAFVDQHPGDDDMPSLRLRVLKLEQDVANLSAFVRNEFKRRTSG